MLTIGEGNNNKMTETICLNKEHKKDHVRDNLNRSIMCLVCGAVWKLSK